MDTKTGVLNAAFDRTQDAPVGTVRTGPKIAGNADRVARFAVANLSEMIQKPAGVDIGLEIGDAGNETAPAAGTECQGNRILTPKIRNCAGFGGSLGDRVRMTNRLRTRLR